MGNAALYPDPPHLSVSIYPDRVAEEVAFSAVCRALERRGATPTDRVDTAPSDAAFTSVSDLAEVIEHRRVDAARFAALVHAEDADAGAAEGAPGEHRVIRAGYTVKPVGLAVVGYDRSVPGVPHPISVLADAGPLGLPDDAWSGRERRAAAKVGTWARDLLRAVCAEVDPLYGALAIEDSLPVPAELAAYGDRLTTVYVSARLLRSRPKLEGRLRDCYADGDVVDWEKGVFLSGWAPFNEAGRSVADARETGRRTAALLGDAAVAWTAVAAETGDTPAAYRPNGDGGANGGHGGGRATL